MSLAKCFANTKTPATLQVEVNEALAAINNEYDGKPRNKTEAKERAIDALNNLLEAARADRRAVVAQIKDTPAWASFEQPQTTLSDKSAKPAKNGDGETPSFSRKQNENGNDSKVVDAEKVLFQSKLPNTLMVDGAERQTTNSKGQQLHTTAEGVVNFWRWFGKSKVVDAEGKPLVMYHGSKSDFSTFSMDEFGKTDDGWLGEGFYFTPDADYASGYTRKNRAVAEGGNVKAVYLKLDNPWYADGVMPDSITTQDLRAGQFDGVIYDASGVERGGDHAEYMVFDPEQIKSSISNNGNFDASNPDIRFSRDNKDKTPERKPTIKELYVANNKTKPLNQRLTDLGMEPVVALRDIPTEAMGIGKRIAETLGFDVTFIQPHSDFDGVSYEGQAFVSPQTNLPAIAVIGHEVKHSLKSQDADAYQSLLGSIETYFKDGVIDAKRQWEDANGGKNTTVATATEEVLADLNGAMWLDSKFWAELADNDPSAFRKVAYKFMELATKVLQGVGRFDASTMVTNVDAVRTIIAKEWARQAQKRGAVEVGIVGEFGAASEAAKYEAEAIRAAAIPYFERERQAAIAQKFDEEYQQNSTIDGDEISMDGLDFDEDGDLTDKGQNAYQQRVSDAIEEAASAAFKPIKSLDDIDRYATHQMARDAAKAYLDAAGVRYSEPYSAGSRYIEVYPQEGSPQDDENLTLKLRFSTHENQSRSHTTTEFNWVSGGVGMSLSEMVKSAVEFSKGNTGLGEKVHWSRSEKSIPQSLSQENLANPANSTVKTAQTETPAFKAWFGDSKVVDAEGKPLVVYHGTVANITQVDKTTLGQNTGAESAKAGFFFTDDSTTADSYANYAATDAKIAALLREAEAAEQAENWDAYDAKVQQYEALDASFADPENRMAGQNVVPVFLALKNPLRIDAKGENAVGFDIAKAVKRAVKGKHDGLILENLDDAAGLSNRPATHFVVFEPTQIKSATGNNGNFDTSNADIRFSRANNGFDLPEFGKVAKSIETVQNRYNRWKQTLTAVKEQGGLVDDTNDFSSAEERYWGIVGTKSDDFKSEVTDFVKDVRDDNLTLDQVAEYAYALHAAERNDHISKINPSMPDGGSGMTTAKAQGIIDQAAKDDTQTALARHAATLHDWTEGTRKVLVDNGLISEDERKQWENSYKSYVPLRGQDGVTESRNGTGQGFDIRGKESKRAFGRSSQAQNIIENIIQDRTRALVRSGKNEVLRYFAKFVLDNPDPSLWQVNAVEKRRGIVKTEDGEMVIEAEGIDKLPEHTVAMKDGGETIYIRIYDDKLLDQLKNFNSEENIGKFIGAMLWGNRMMSRMYTSLSPVFALFTNPARDIQAATLNMVGSRGYKAGLRQVVAVPAAWGPTFMAEAAGKPSPMYREFQLSGGKTGFLDYKDIDAQVKELQKLVSQADITWNPATWVTGQGWATPFLAGSKALGSLLSGIETIFGVMENATRFAAYKAARERGESVASSASLSKNLTVNFNRKGTSTSSLSAFFLFFNPAVQGSARMLEALKSPKVLSVLGVAMTGVALLALQNADAGDDDDGIAWWDKIPDYEKERNLIFVLPPTSKAGESIPGTKTGRYLKIPMPYGYNVFAVMANNAVDMMRNKQDPKRGMTAGKAALSTGKAFAGSWIPVNGVSTSLENQAAIGTLGIPSIFDPIAQNMLNISGLGRKLYRDDEQAQNLPDSENFGLAQRGTLGQKIAAKLNSATGGSKFREGGISVTPASVNNVIRGYGGAPAGFVMDAANVFLRNGVERDEPDWYKAPFVKQAYGQIDSAIDQSRAYDAIHDIKKKSQSVKRATDAGDKKELGEILKAEGPLALLGQEATATQKALSEIRKAEMAVIDSTKMGDTEKTLRLRMLDNKARQASQSLQKAINRSHGLRDRINTKGNALAGQVIDNANTED